MLFELSWRFPGGDEAVCLSFPCNECAKAIIQAGIRTVVYDSDKYEGTPPNRAAKWMFDAAGVNYVQYRKTGRMIRIEV